MSSHNHSDHEMSKDDKGDGFMSMVMMTKDLPASSDGLKMEAMEVRFGPKHPVLPPSLVVHFTMDGDTVRTARFTVSKSHATEPTTVTLESQLVWLHRIAVAVGYPLLQQTIHEASTAPHSANVKEAASAFNKMNRLATKNPLLRIRLKNLAIHKNMDVYQRLIRGIEDVADTSAWKTHKKLAPDFTTPETIAPKLVGLELAQAFVAIASFHIDIGKVAEQ